MGNCLYESYRKTTERIKKLLLILMLAVMCSSVARADDLGDGSVAYLSGDYVTALKLWRPLAEQGDASAQYYLGLMYHEGSGVIQDYKEAFSWYRKAAEQGHAETITLVGCIRMAKA